MQKIFLLFVSLCGAQFILANNEKPTIYLSFAVTPGLLHVTPVINSIEDLFNHLKEILEKNGIKSENSNKIDLRNVYLHLSVPKKIAGAGASEKLG